MVPRVRIPNPPSPSKLHNLKRHPGLLRQQMISHLPEDDLPRTEEEEEQAAHPFLVGIRTAPARSTGVIVYQLQNFWERTTSAVSNFLLPLQPPRRAPSNGKNSRSLLVGGPPRVSCSAKQSASGGHGETTGLNGETASTTHLDLQKLRRT